MGCFKQPRNIVQLCTAPGPEAKAGCLAVGGGGDVAGVGEEGQRGCQHLQELYRPHKAEQAPAVPCAQPDTQMPGVVPAQPGAGESGRWCIPRSWKAKVQHNHQENECV